MDGTALMGRKIKVMYAQPTAKHAETKQKSSEKRASERGPGGKGKPRPKPTMAKTKLVSAGAQPKASPVVNVAKAEAVVNDETAPPTAILSNNKAKTKRVSAGAGAQPKASPVVDVAKAEAVINDETAPATAILTSNKGKKKRARDEANAVAKENNGAESTVA